MKSFLKNSQALKLFTYGATDLLRQSKGIFHELQSFENVFSFFRFATLDNF